MNIIFSDYNKIPSSSEGKSEIFKKKTTKIISSLSDLKIKKSTGVVYIYIIVAGNLSIILCLKFKHF